MKRVIPFCLCLLLLCTLWMPPAFAAPVSCGAQSVALMEKTKVSAVEKSMELEPSVAAPVQEGQQLGTLTVTSGGEVLAEVPLVAGETVERLSYRDIVQKLFVQSLFTV